MGGIAPDATFHFQQALITLASSVVPSEPPERVLRHAIAIHQALLVPSRDIPPASCLNSRIQTIRAVNIVR
jgi:hypothetical protein